MYKIFKCSIKPIVKFKFFKFKFIIIKKYFHFNIKKKMNFTDNLEV